MQVMGHTSRRTFLAYMSNTVSVDAQAIMFGENSRVNEIDFVRSMSFHRDLHGPKPSTSSLTQSGVRAPRTFVSAEEELKRRLMERERLKDERRQFEQGSRKYDDLGALPHGEEDFDYLEEGGIERVRPRPSLWMSVLLRYDTTRAEVVRNFYSKEGKESLSLQQAIEPLVKMADPSPWFATYPIPGAGADDNYDECPSCGKSAKL